MYPLLIAFFAGMLTKFLDILGERLEKGLEKSLEGRKAILYLFALLDGILLSYLALLFPSPILGILLGVAVASKIDNKINLLLFLLPVVVGLISLFSNLSFFSFFAFLLFSLASFLDEIKTAKLFNVKIRPVVPLLSLLLAIAGFYSFYLFFLVILSFDIGYIVISITHG